MLRVLVLTIGCQGLAASPSPQRILRRKDSYKGFDDSQLGTPPVRGAVAGTLPTAAGVRQDCVEIVLTPAGKPVLRLFWGYGESSTDPPVGVITNNVPMTDAGGPGSLANWIVRPGSRATAQRETDQVRQSALRKPNAKRSDSMVRFDIDGVVEMPGSELEMPGKARARTPPPMLSETEDPAVCLMQKHLELGRITIRQFSRIALMLFEASGDPVVQVVRSKMLAPGTSDQEQLHIVEVSNQEPGSFTQSKGSLWRHRWPTPCLTLAWPFRASYTGVRLLCRSSSKPRRYLTTSSSREEAEAAR